jgi:drug/metabolite transporter (DMT)-like permease
MKSTEPTGMFGVQAQVAGAAAVAAESVLALTPIAIKKSPLDTVSTVWSRILSSAVLGFMLSSDHLVKQTELVSVATLGLTNLVHVASSYESFRHLPAGQAMSILYTYPFWNLVFESVFRGQTVTASQLGIIAGAMGGSVLMNMDSHAVAAASPTVANPNPVWGTVMAFLMAFTESGMYTIIKSLGWTDSAKLVWVLNTGASIWLAIVSLVFMTSSEPSKSSQTARVWSYDMLVLTAFHSISLFSGYWLRFYAIPRLSAVTYSMLSYSGLLAAFLYGALFVGETPGALSFVGAAIIALCGGVLLL